MKDDVSSYLKQELESDVLEIDGELIISTNIEGLVRAVDKEFFLTANYPKGKGDQFKNWIVKHYPGSLFLNVNKLSGGRYDVCFESVGSIYMNRIHYVEYLDEALSMANKNNTLEESLFVILNSVQMIASVKGLSISYLYFVIPIRWLAGNSHKLHKYNWSVRSNRRAIDLLEEAIVKLCYNGNLIIDESFMSRIFHELIKELEPIKENLSFIFEKKKQSLIHNQLGTTERT